MAAVIDMLMPAASNGYAAAAASILVPYVAAFADADMTINPRPWDQAPGPEAPDATLALFAWGYHVDVTTWLAMLDRWPARAPLLNPPGLLRWNTRKTYLADLQSAGIKIVPSLFGDADQAAIDGAFDHFGVEELLVKPQISPVRYRTNRVRRGDLVDGLVNAIIQPFLPSVGFVGELSLFWIGGRFSHAARKVAAAGEFRVQPQFGGVFSALAPSDEAMGMGEAAIAALPAAPLYARVDLLTLADGTLALIELEAIEPDLYPDIAPEVPARLAQAVARALRQ